MPDVGFNFLEFEACVSVEHSADHLVEDLKEQRPDKWKLSCDMQTVSIRLYAYSYGSFYQAYGLFAGNVFDHLQINSRPREDYLFGMQLFFLGQIFVFVTQFVAKLHRVIDQNIRLLIAELLSQLTQEIRKSTELFIISFIDHILCSPAFASFDLPQSNSVAASGFSYESKHIRICSFVHFSTASAGGRSFLSKNPISVVSIFSSNFPPSYRHSTKTFNIPL